MIFFIISIQLGEFCKNKKTKIVSFFKRKKYYLNNLFTNPIILAKSDNELYKD